MPNPDNNLPEYAEAGLASRVKHATTLYIPEGINNNLHFAIPTTQQQSIIKHANKVTLLPGQRVIVKPLEIKSPIPSAQVEYHPSWVLVTTYKEEGKQRTDMPESGPTIILEQTGIMPISALRASDQYVTPVKGDIFPPGHVLSSKHIFQGNMGDCFLLAPIISLLETRSEDGAANGDKLLIKMIRQEGRYSIVTFYNPETYETHELKVSNTTLCQNSSSKQDPRSNTAHDIQVNHVFPWVHIIEIAYASFGWRSDQKRPEQNRNTASHLGVYSGGGDPAVAFKILTGQQAKNTTITLKSILSPWSMGSITLATTYYLRKVMGNDETADSYLDQYISEHSELAGLDKTVWLDWGKYLTELNALLDAEGKKRWDQLLNLFEDRIYIHDLPTIFEQLLKFNPPVPQAIISKFNEWSQHVIKTTAPDSEAVTIEGRFVGALGTGIYTKKQLDLFNLIQDKLNNHEFLVASTYELDDVAGLRGPHAYAIEGVEVIKINGKWVKFLKLINPWGNTGRIYDWSNDQAWYALGKNWAKEDINKGHFLLELSESTQFFATLTSCPNPNVKRPQLLAVANPAANPEIEKANTSEKSGSIAADNNDQIQGRPELSQSTNQPRAVNNSVNYDVILTTLSNNHLTVKTKTNIESPNVCQNDESRLACQLNNHLPVESKLDLESSAVSQQDDKNKRAILPTVSAPASSVVAAKSEDVKNKQIIAHGLQFFRYHESYQQVNLKHSRQKTAAWIKETAAQLSPDNSVDFLYACYHFTYKEKSELTNNLQQTLTDILGEAPIKLNDQQVNKKLHIHEIRFSLIRSLFAYIESEERSLSYKMSYLCHSSITNYLKISSNEINANCDYARHIIGQFLDVRNNNKMIEEVLQDIKADSNVNKPSQLSSSLQNIIDGHRDAFVKVFVVQ